LNEEFAAVEKFGQPVVPHFPQKGEHAAQIIFARLHQPVELAAARWRSVPARVA